MRLAMIGTRGVPARYGGFETCVEEVGARLAEAGHDVVVYCRHGNGPSTDTPPSYRGMTLVHLPAVRHRALETLSHTAASVAHLVTHPVDAVVLFNVGNAPLLPLLRARRLPVATHLDGLEWKRAKWAGIGSRYYRVAESLAVRWSDALIADAQGIRDYYVDRFGVYPEVIRYGAPIVTATRPERLADLDLQPRRYHLVVARLEPENNVHLIVEGHRASAAKLPLVVVGSVPYRSAYARMLPDRADDRVRFVGPVWDQSLLDELYANALTYAHGHSVGGTNPSLLRAIGAGTCTLAYDVSFNREVLAEAGWYWRDSAELARLFERAEAEPDRVLRRAPELRARARDYDWDDVAARYEALCADLRGRRRATPPTDSRRTPCPEGGTRS